MKLDLREVYKELDGSPYEGKADIERMIKDVEEGVDEVQIEDQETFGDYTHVFAIIINGLQKFIIMVNNDGNIQVF